MVCSYSALELISLKGQTVVNDLLFRGYSAVSWWSKGWK